MNIKPKKIRLEASTACQLKCPLCPTGKGDIDKWIGTGFLKFQDFKNLVDENPEIHSIELSNWGEIFLNNELVDIIQYAHQKYIQLEANNGVNLNTAKEEVLEALVRYQFHSMTCSIDGTSQDTYSFYRRDGHFKTVIANIKKINAYKKKYGSEFPRLTWQFIAFGHNEHEIEKAQKMAKALNLVFQLKFSGDGAEEALFSPVKNKELVRKKSGLGVATRAEYREKYTAGYLADQICTQLWTSPQINYDGKMLGCCNNYWSDFGNVFTDGLSGCLNNDRINYARAMVMGKKESRQDIPCARCFVYKERLKEKLWIDLQSTTP